METVTSFYKFVFIPSPQVLQGDLKALSSQLRLKGTVLIAAEGINGSVAGSSSSIASFKAYFHQQASFADLEFKDSQAADESFRRMLVKVKKEIITMRCAVDPERETGYYLDALEFKRWQDEGRDMLVIDTRNAYEVALGTFKTAMDPAIASFGEFPAWIDQTLSDDEKEKTIVTFCTGGIRCEKATAYMRQKGFKNVYQLRGGILKYFEETHGLEAEEHWQGECVVFDKRKAVTKDLKASEQVICYVCLQVLNAQNIAERVYPAGKVCRDCAQSMDSHWEQRTERGLQRHAENLTKRAAFLRERREEFQT